MSLKLVSSPRIISATYSEAAGWSIPASAWARIENGKLILSPGSYRLESPGTVLYGKYGFGSYGSSPISGTGSIVTDYRFSWSVISYAGTTHPLIVTKLD